MKLAMIAACAVQGCLVGAAAIADPGDFVIGAGIEGDSDDGVAVSMLGELSLHERTWLSGSVAYSGVDLPRQQRVDYVHADLAVDHIFDPFGIRLGVAYWGDSDILDSTDVRGSVYSQGDSGWFAIDGEYREFDFNIPAQDALPRAAVGFDASGYGMSGRIDINDSSSFRASGMRYEYSREFRLGDAARVSDVLTFSRLSVLSSLVDWRAGAGIGIDAGSKRWQFDVSKWRGVVDNSDNLGVTISYLTPVTESSDVEISIGYDDSNLYGDILFLSFFVYLYGGD